MTKFLSTILFFALLSAGTGMLSGCGGSKQAQQELRYVWPEMPDSPRVAYLRTFRGERDFSGGLSGFVGKLSGDETSINFSRPFDICEAGEGKFYVSDADQGVIMYDVKNEKVESIGEKSVISLKDARGISYGRGRLYVGVAGSKKVAILDDEGKAVGAIGKEGTFPNPVDVLSDTARRRVYIVDSQLHQVFVYTESGDSLFVLGKGRGEADGQFNYPMSIAFDDSGNLYVVDGFNYRIQIFDPNGNYLRQFGSQGEQFGQFMRPKGIALDSYQNIYVVDGMHRNFQMFTKTGELLMFVGRLSSRNDGFDNPISIFIDKSDKIYVTDNLNRRVQVFQLLKGN